jgi:hypothetical protein
MMFTMIRLPWQGHRPQPVAIFLFAGYWHFLM